MTRGTDTTLRGERELVNGARAGDSRASATLVGRLLPTARALSREFFLPGRDRADVESHAWIGFAEGLRGYRPGATDRPLAYLRRCMRREVLDAIHVSLAKKRGRQHVHVSLDETVGPSEDPLPRHEVIASPTVDPLERTIRRERFTAFAGGLASAPPLEQESARGLILGESYREISARTGATAKQIDNALLRVKKRLAA